MPSQSRNRLHRANWKSSLGRIVTSPSPFVEAGTLLFVLAIAAPVLFLKFDRWDGAIIADAMRTHDLSGIEVWFTEGQGPITLVVLEALLSFDNWGDFIRPSYIGLAGALYSAFGIYIVGSALFSNRIVAAVCCLLFSSSPLVVLNSSSIIGLGNLYVGMGLTGFFLLRRHSLAAKFAGFVFMIISLQLYSMLFLLGAMLIIDAVRSIVTERKVPLVNFLVTILLFLAFLLIFVVIFRRSGLYSDYNAFDTTAIVGLPGAFFASPFWTSFGVQFLGLGAVMLAVSFFFSRPLRERPAGPLLDAALFVGVYGAVCLPYLLADKWPSDYLSFANFALGRDVGVFPYVNWSFRHAVLAVGAASLGLGSVFLAAFSDWRAALLGGALILFIVVAQTGATIVAWRQVLDRDLQAGKLVTDWSGQIWPENAACFVPLDRYPMVKLDGPRYYELHYLASFAARPRNTVLVPQGTPTTEIEEILQLVCRSSAYAVKYGLPDIDCTKLDDFRAASAAARICN